MYIHTYFNFRSIYWNWKTKTIHWKIDVKSKRMVKIMILINYLIGCFCTVLKNSTVMLFVITFSYILLKWIALDEANTRTAVLTQELTKLQKVISKSKKASEVSLLVKVRHRVVVWCRTLNTSNIIIKYIRINLFNAIYV